MQPPTDHITAFGILWFAFLIFMIWSHIGIKRTLLLCCAFPLAIWIVFTLKMWLAIPCFLIAWWLR